MGLLRKLVHSCCDSTCEGTFTNSLLKNHGCSTTPGGSTKNLRPEEGGRETLSILFSTSDAVREALLLFFSGFTKCLTLSDPLDCSPPGSSVHGISQARTVEWVAISYSRGSS